MRQAVDQLVVEGRLYRVPGKGTFVSRPKIDMPLRLASSFTAEMRSPRDDARRGRPRPPDDPRHTVHIARGLQLQVGGRTSTP